MRKKGDAEIERFCWAFADVAIVHEVWRHVGKKRFLYSRPLFGVQLIFECRYSVGNEVQFEIEVWLDNGLSCGRGSYDYLSDDVDIRESHYFAIKQICRRLRESRTFSVLQEQAAIEKSIRRKPPSPSAQRSQRL